MNSNPTPSPIGKPFWICTGLVLLLALCYPIVALIEGPWHPAISWYKHDLPLSLFLFPFLSFSLGLLGNVFDWSYVTRLPWRLRVPWFALLVALSLAALYIVALEHDRVWYRPPMLAGEEDREFAYRSFAEIWESVMKPVKAEIGIAATPGCQKLLRETGASEFAVSRESMSSCNGLADYRDRLAKRQITAPRPSVFSWTNDIGSLVVGLAVVLWVCFFLALFLQGGRVSDRVRGKVTLSFILMLPFFPLQLYGEWHHSFGTLIFIPGHSGFVVGGVLAASVGLWLIVDRNWKNRNKVFSIAVLALTAVSTGVGLTLERRAFAAVGAYFESMPPLVLMVVALILSAFVATLVIREISQAPR